jgi:hypothetical protein
MFKQPKTGKEIKSAPTHMHLCDIKMQERTAWVKVEEYLPVHKKKKGKENKNNRRLRFVDFFE